VKSIAFSIGSAPNWPAAYCSFCSWIAERMSLAVRSYSAIWSGCSQIRIE